jgi:hypothetical protein
MPSLLISLLKPVGHQRASDALPEWAVRVGAGGAVPAKAAMSQEGEFNLADMLTR